MVATRVEIDACPAAYVSRAEAIEARETRLDREMLPRLASDELARVVLALFEPALVLRGALVALGRVPKVETELSSR